MPHDRDERPTSLWKKEISFKRKPREDAPDVEQQPVASSSGSVWKKELSLRRKPKVADEPTASGDEPVGDAPAPEPPVAAAAEPAPPSVDHGWLTQPLEEISDPPAEETTDLLPPPRPTLHALPQPEAQPAPLPGPVPLPVPAPADEQAPEPQLPPPPPAALAADPLLPPEPPLLSDDVLAKLSGTRIGGKLIELRPDRGAPGKRDDRDDRPARKPRR